MQWLDDAPESWESAPEDPPAVAPRTTVDTHQEDASLTLREEGSEEAYIRSEDERVSLYEYA